MDANAKPHSAKPSIRERIRAFGRTYFSRNTERAIFFFLTVAMLTMGLLAKMHLL